MCVLSAVITKLEDLPFIEVSPGGSLKILGVQDVDAGDYECIAVNEAGTASAVVNLDIGCTSPNSSLSSSNLFVSLTASRTRLALISFRRHIAAVLPFARRQYCAAPVRIRALH